MATLRKVVLILLVVAWFPATQGCMLAAAFPHTFTAPCQDDCGSGEPCNSSCGGCVDWGNSLMSKVWNVVSAPRPNQCENVELTRELAMLAAAHQSQEEALPVFDSSPPEPPVWRLVVRTALPVRGPSFAS